jgi:tripartite-type tricarboxylate transporter receptor subunit TctC
MAGHDRRWSVVGLAMALCAMLAVLVPQPLLAQADYPSRPVRLVLPFGAGGVADTTARLVADKLGAKLGTRFVVENQPGAGGIAAARAVTSAPADGYTLALLSNGTAVSVPLFKSLPFDPLKDFVPISSLGVFDFILATKADSEFATVADFVKAAKAKPGALNVGTINVGSTQNLSAELLKTAAGIDFTIIPYRASPDAMVAALQGNVAVVIESYSGLKPHLVSKQLRALGSSGPTRSENTKDVPTVQEAGIAGFEVTSWNALFAPTGTPPEVVAKLNAALREVLAEPELKQKLLEMGIEAKPSTPEEIAARLRSDIEKWRGVIEKAGVPRQ